MDTQQYGGSDAFNALMTEQRRDLSLAAVRRQHEEVHARLLDLVRHASEELFACLRDTRVAALTTSGGQVTVNRTSVELYGRQWPNRS